MHWKTDWWGITLIADNEEEKVMLQSLHKKLDGDDKLLSRYDQGEIMEEIEGEQAFSKSDNFCLVFVR